VRFALDMERSGEMEFDTFEWVMAGLIVFGILVILVVHLLVL